MNSEIQIDPKLDLIFERYTDLSIDEIWQGWTDPQTLMTWLCPRPWKVTDCRIELFAGGEFFTVMNGPNGEKVDNHGSFLEVIEKKKLVWTNMMSKGFRPASIGNMGFAFAVILNLSKTSQGTLYRAVVRHADEAGRIQHEKMGFQEGWGLAFNQLVEVMKKN